ncbi:hypothetical protein ACVIHA_004413 [Bradyrhizobium liaoningense]
MRARFVVRRHPTIEIILQLVDGRLDRRGPDPLPASTAQHSAAPDDVRFVASRTSLSPAVLNRGTRRSHPTIRSLFCRLFWLGTHKVNRRTDLSPHRAPAQQGHRYPYDYVVHHIIVIMRSPRLCGVCGGKLVPAAVFSPISLRIIRLASGHIQHGQELVGRPESTGRQHRRRHGGERFELLCRIGAKVDLGALQAGVSEP